MTVSWNDPLSNLNGIGSATNNLLHKLGLFTVGDVLEFYPRKYEDYSKIVTIDQIKPGLVTVKAKIRQMSGRYVRGGLHITEAIASDDSGSVKLVWFNQPYRKNSIKQFENYLISGNYEFKNGRLYLSNPSIELESDLPINTARIIPIYPETKGLKSRQIRKIIKVALGNLAKINESLPTEIIESQNLISRSQAIKIKHFPASNEDLNKANERLGFEELFELILASQHAKSELNQNSGIKINFDQKIAKKFVKNLDFSLTSSQKQAVWQIYQDLESGKIMNRLLEGDVGSGKTMVAVMSALMVLKNSFQVALMVPTEILARQHAESINKILTKNGFVDAVHLLVGSMKHSQKKQVQAIMSESKPMLIIGTHSLIQEHINFTNLALIIVDEQHRFGVAQRQKLLKTTNNMPHMLSLTATPIPRSLALTVFGELDISLLSEKPKHQTPIETKIVQPSGRLKIYDFVENQLKTGFQAFVVCPIINDSEFLKLKSAKQTFNEISKNFKDFKVKLLHGKQNDLENQAIMQDFIIGKIDILVATTMIEVGVDVPNATVMLIESPERFGLAQLHQLRGRIGRGSAQGYCFLMSSDGNNVNSRLRALESTNDGFKLAELDLKLRGAGSLYGTSQHGIHDLKIADFTDIKLITRARMSALEFLKNPNNLLQYPSIKQRIAELQSVVHLN